MFTVIVKPSTGNAPISLGLQFLTSVPGVALPPTHSPWQPHTQSCPQHREASRTTSPRHRKLHSRISFVPFYFSIVSLLAALGCSLGARAFSHVECAAKTTPKTAQEAAGGLTRAQSRRFSSGQSSWEALPACTSTAPPGQ